VGDIDRHSSPAEPAGESRRKRTLILDKEDASHGSPAAVISPFMVARGAPRRPGDAFEETPPSHQSGEG
jgi:hypothetical protein